MQLENLKPMEAADVAGKRVLVRVDLNVPMADGRVTDATRLERVVPTIRSLSERGARVVVMSHLGRPKGEHRQDLTLAPVAEKLGTMLKGISVRFLPECVGASVSEGVGELASGEVAVLENLRFHAGEERNAPDFTESLSEIGDIYVNDAFSTAHRAHASTEGLAHKLPGFAGPLMMAEIDALRTALEKPERPVAAVIGGAKVSTKIPVLTNMTAKVDVMIIGGGMANTFLMANGIDVGASLAEPGLLDEARQITERAKENGCEIVLPLDAVVAKAFEAGAPSETVDVDDVPTEDMILDIGSRSVADLVERIGKCRTLLWNGPLGAFEIEPFGNGTFALAREAARLTKAGSLATIAGGGDTVAALNKAGVTQDFTYVSTAGGAFLEWLEGRELPGVVALTRHSG